MVRALVIGFVLGILILFGGLYYYFASGMAPAAVADSPMPFEKRIANMALDAHVQKQAAVQSPVPADEPSFLAGVNVYQQDCQGCHGMPGQKSEFATAMYPPPPQLFEGKGVSDDPVQETYWKVVNGIRLTGMPAFKGILDDKQCWQVSQLLARSNELSDAVKKALATNPSPQLPTK